MKADRAFFHDRLKNNFTNTVGSTLVQTAIKDGYLQAALLTGLVGSLQGELAQNIADVVDFQTLIFLNIQFIKSLMQQLDVLRRLQLKQVVRLEQLVQVLVKSRSSQWGRIHGWRNNTYRDAGNKVAGVVSAYARYDVNTAANAADIAIENNNNTRGGPKRSLFVYLAKRAANYLAPDKSADPKVVANFWLKRTDQNLLKEIDLDHIAQGHLTTNQGNVRAFGFHNEPTGGTVARVKM